MTPEERQLLTALSDRIKSAPVQEPDREAEQVLQDLIDARPDTPYLLAQTVLIQDFGMRNAQAQIADLRRQLQEAQQRAAPAPSGGSFLGNLFGHGQAAPAPASVPAAGPWGPAQPQQAYAPPPYGAGYAPVVMQPSQTSGFLRQAATTAAGIAGGALLFEGIQSLFSGHSGFGYGGMGGGFGGGFAPTESLSETTIVNNNYYDQPGGAPADPGRADYQPDQGTQDTPGMGPDPGYQDVSDNSADFGGGGDSDFGGGGGGDDYA